VPGIHFSENSLKCVLFDTCGHFGHRAAVKTELIIQRSQKGIRMPGSFRRLLLIFALAVLGPGAAPIMAAGNSARGAEVQRGSLDTPEQLKAERLLIELLADPAIQTAQRQTETSLARTLPLSRQGKALFHNAMEQWTRSLIMREIASDPARPSILWIGEITPHRWHGFEVSHGKPGMNPDNVYRFAFLDGGGRYEITGQVDRVRGPAQFSFEFTRGTAGDLASNPNGRFKRQIAMLLDERMTVAADGSFRITIGGEGSGPNHVATDAEPIALMIRDTMSDWRQVPNRLAIRRLDPVGSVPFDKAAVRARVIADLPGYAGFWTPFGDNLRTRFALNGFRTPEVRPGDWGFAIGANIQIGPDEAFVFRTRDGGARYTGTHIRDFLNMTPNARSHFISLNNSQAVRDRDGNYTYVVAARDPGVANWLEVPVLEKGALILLRWQGLAPGARGEDLVIDARVMTLADVAALDTPRVTRAQRAAALAERRVTYRARLGVE